jgi:hypothetical protein
VDGVGLLAIVGLLATKPRRLGSQEGRAGGELRALAGLLLFFVPGRAACRAEAAAHARPVAPGRAGLSPIIPCRAHARVGSKKNVLRDELLGLVLFGHLDPSAAGHHPLDLSTAGRRRAPSSPSTT